MLSRCSKAHVVDRYMSTNNNKLLLIDKILKLLFLYFKMFDIINYDLKLLKISTKMQYSLINMLEHFGNVVECCIILIRN